VKQTATKLKPTQLTFTGFGVKVVNLSPEPVLLFWDGPSKPQLIGEIGPYEALGTAATKAGQSFSVTPVHDRDHHMERWVATADDPIHYFQPDGVQHHDHKRLTLQLLNREYERHYLVQTGRQWLAQFPRPPPVHSVWPATHFGQKHNLVTRQKNYKLEVVSVMPRVFSIDGFLSHEECDALIDLARAQGLEPSTLQAGRNTQQSRDRSTRSSSNTWLTRDAANVTEAIYRRAARVLRMDESLLQKPLIGDHYHEHEHSLAESLQVVRYQQDEEYKAHHDFTYPPAFRRHQPTRFATVLFYLNDDFEGGQTVFPRAVNAQYHEGITVEPHKGKAVLFYNMLPDGNMDDLSMHASQKVIHGEKFLANLWVWGK
jgi:prolyl 4-hydroxylase